MYKISKIVVLVLSLLGVVLWGALAFSSPESTDSFSIEGLYYISYILLIACVLVALVSGARNIMSSPKALKKTALYTGVFLVIVLVSYIFSLGEKTTEDTLVSTGLFTFYILMFVAVVLLVLSGVKNALTK